jgi:hypothetical protein
LINIDLGTFRNGRLTMTNVTLNDAIKLHTSWCRTIRWLDRIGIDQCGSISWHRRLLPPLLISCARWSKEQRVLSYVALKGQALNAAGP